MVTLVDREEAQRKAIKLIGANTSIVSNASSELAPSDVALDIVNWVPDRVGQLKKIPIGYYRHDFSDTIAKVIAYPEKQASRLLISTASGGLYRLLNETATPLSFPSQTPLIHNATAQGTVITGYFTYRNNLFLLTGNHVAYVYDGKDVTLWGQDGIIPPVSLNTILEYSYTVVTTVAVHVVVLPSTSNGYCYEATTGGDTSGTEPTWPTTIGDTVTDGTVVWTCKDRVSVKDTDEDYNYRITWWDGKSESNPSPEAGIPVSPTNGLVAISFNTGLSNVEQIRIYRYDYDTNNYRFVRSVDKSVAGLADDATAVFIDQIAGFSLGRELEYDNGNPPPGRFATVYANRAFMAGDTANPNRLYYSKHEVPYSWRSSVVIEDKGGDKIVGLATLKTELLIFKQYATHVLTGISEDTFSVKELFPVGAYSHDSIVVAGDMCYFMSREGFYETDGMSVRKISSPIDDYFNAENQWTLKDTTAMYVPQMGAIYWNIGKSFSPADEVTWIYFIERRQWFRTTMGITSGANMDGETYFALTSKVYQLVDTGYPTVKSIFESHPLPLSNSVDKAIVRHISITGGGMEVGTALDIYYKADYATSWTLLRSVAITSAQDTKRVSCNIPCNYLQVKLEHTGDMEKLVQVTVEFMYKRLEPHE